jgi:hypothetical protein
MKKSLSRSCEEGKDRLAVEPAMSVIDAELTQIDQLIELPDRKEITLCEAVTAFVYGKAYDLRQWRNRSNRSTEQIDFLGLEQIHALTDRTGKGQETTELVDTLNRKAEDLLEQLHRAAYAGRVKFRAIKEFGDPADGYKDIDPLYFYINPLFNWPEDVIVHREDESSTPWYFVHLDREDFASLLRDMGVSVQQSLDPDVKGERKTFRTGVAGRPTSKHLVRTEAQRRLDTGDYPESLAAFSEQLAAWLEVAEPEAAPMTAKTIQNNLRELWRSKRPK